MLEVTTTWLEGRIIQAWHLIHKVVTTNTDRSGYIETKIIEHSNLSIQQRHFKDIKSERSTQMEGLSCLERLSALAFGQPTLLVWL